MLIESVRNVRKADFITKRFQEVLKGKFRDKTITIERYGVEGRPTQGKTITIDGPNFQTIVNKVRNENGKFDRMV